MYIERYPKAPRRHQQPARLSCATRRQDNNTPKALPNQDNEPIYHAVEVCSAVIDSGTIFERYFGLHLRRQEPACQIYLQ